MSTGQIVAIIVLVVLIAGAVGAFVYFRRRDPNARRLEAEQQWREAEQRRASAERLEAEANQRAEHARIEQAQAAELAARARQDREVAEKAAARAAKLDPERKLVPSAADDHHPALPAHADPSAEQRTDRLRTDDRPRRRYVEPEPIVGGSAEGLLEKRRGSDQRVPTPRSADHDEIRPEQDTVPTPRPDHGGATDPHHGRTLADRIMGR